MSVHGPFSRFVNLPEVSTKRQVWYRQTPISESPLRYDVDNILLLDRADIGYPWSPWAGGGAVEPLSFFNSELQQAIRLARERFNASLGETSQVATTLAEWKQSVGMITTRALQLLDFMRAIRKGRFGDAGAALGGSLLRKPPKGLHKGKPPADNFLEWHFGWSPLLSDIYNSVNILQGQPPQINRARGRGTSEAITFEDFHPGGSQTWFRKRNCVLRCEMAATVRVSNPNLFLANRLGLVNPVSVAWELVPFSFVVDWFVPVGAFLNQFTDFVGLSLENPRTTVTADLYEINDNSLLPYFRSMTSVRRFHMVRSLEIEDFKLRANRFTGLSASRGATAIALLIQNLRK